MPVALEDRPNPSGWRTLLDLALPALDEVVDRYGHRVPVGSPSWTLGGGTAIALHLAHRTSDDVDLFVPWFGLKAFTPAHNRAAAAISPRFQWPGSYLKFERDEGEIDFLTPQLQTEPGFDWETYKGRAVALERPEEVVVKKVRYRGSRLAERDVFDLAAVASVDGTLAQTLADEVPDMLPRLTVSLDTLRARKASLERFVRPLPGFEDLLATAVEDTSRLVETAVALAAAGPRGR